MQGGNGTLVVHEGKMNRGKGTLIVHERRTTCISRVFFSRKGGKMYTKETKKDTRSTWREEMVHPLYMGTST